MTLASFIQELDDLFKKRNPLITRVKSPEKLLAALRDLDALVEMHDAKKTVISQIKYLLISITSGRPYSGHMLHTVIYGPPGVGKSRLGVCLAKIWVALGLLKQPVSIDRSKDKEDQIKQLEDLVNRKERSLQGLQRNHRRHLDLVRTARYNTTRIERIRYRSNQCRYIDRIVEDLDQVIDDLDRARIVESHGNKKEEDVPFIIAGRPDLVGRFVGHSAPKTRAFFEANRGKVIFIDEAYSLILGPQDSFGFEALTELNKCMSEYPDEVIIQFGGYKDLMHKTIFSEKIGQPGLERRCPWVFDITGYTPSGLAAIFQYQLKKDGWSVDANIDLIKFFNCNKENFKAYGGDTEKLCFYAKQVYSDLLFEEAKKGEVVYTSCLNLNMLNRAIEILKKNKVLPLKNDEPPQTMYM